MASFTNADRVAIAALAISLVALLTTTGQLLQQYFATADGYRRCQASVMAGWSKKTRLRWRWRQFRFETLYTTPEIYLKGLGFGEVDEVLIIGDETSRKLTHATPAETGNITSQEPPQGRRTQRLTKYGIELPAVRAGEIVSWIPLLHYLHIATRASLESEHVLKPRILETTTPASVLCRRTFPALVEVERSWDFQPPDVIRPLAKTTVSTIAILARRMGMRWKDFRPEDGVMRAEGHSHIITSTWVRSLGVVLQYNYTGWAIRMAGSGSMEFNMAGSVYKEQEEVYIATVGADRLGAGVIRGVPCLKIPHFTIGTQKEIVTALRILDISGHCARTLKEIFRQNPEFTLPVADIVAFTSPMICERDSPLVQVPAPSENMTGVTAGCEGRNTFVEKLNAFVREAGGAETEADGEKFDWNHTKIGRQTCVVLWRLKALQEEFPEECDNVNESEELWIVRKPLAYLRKVIEIFNEATGYLETSCPALGIPYKTLLQYHLLHLNFAEDLSEITLALCKPPRLRIVKYFRALPTLQAHLRRDIGVSEKEVACLWMTMMLRAFCWGTCHFFVPGERVPIAYFGSQLPVYIG